MHKILENQYIHNFVQKILVLGRGKVVELTEKYITENCHGKVLDIGCGTGRYSYLFEHDYFGIDINKKYIENTCNDGKLFVCCDAAWLPFKDKSFNSIFSVGFFHHIDNDNTYKSFQEIIRISKPDAKILIIDAFNPDNRCNILGHTLVKLDRGRHIRNKDNFHEELRNYFEVIDAHYVEHSYPYNLYAFILKVR